MRQEGCLFAGILAARTYPFCLAHSSRFCGDLLRYVRLYAGPYSRQNRASQWFDRTDQAAATHGRILTEGSFVCIGGNSRRVAIE